MSQYLPRASSLSVRGINIDVEVRQSFTPNQRFPDQFAIFSAHDAVVFAVVGEESIVVRADAKDAGILAIDLDVVDGGRGGVAVKPVGGDVVAVHGLGRIHGRAKEHEVLAQTGLEGLDGGLALVWDAVKFSRKSVTSCSVMGAGVQPTMSAAAAAAQRVKRFIVRG